MVSTSILIQSFTCADVGSRTSVLHVKSQRSAAFFPFLLSPHSPGRGGLLRGASPGGFSGRAGTSLWHAPALSSRYLGTPSLFAPGSPCVLSDARNPGPCYWRIALGNRDVGPGCDGRSWNAAAPGRQRQDVGECSRTCLSTIPCYPPVLICTKLNVSSLQRLWLSSAASSPVVFNPRLPTERSLAPTIRHPLTYLHA